MEKKIENFKKIMVFGTFDVFHPGHQDFFRQAKKFGDFLVVVVAKDKNVNNIKGAWPKNNEKKRLEIVNRYKSVDKAVLGNKNDAKGYKYKILQEEKPDVICLGYDQRVNEKELQKKLKEYRMDKVKVARLKPYKEGIYKSSLLSDN